MYYALLYYPKFDPETEKRINEFRLEYDPFAKLLGPHLTFVFPVSSEDMDEEQIYEHFNKILSEQTPFQIRINGLEKSWDHWLNLVLKEGNEEVVRLHDQLYTGILAPYFRKDLGFTPHIGIGLFASKDYNPKDPKEVLCDEEKFSKALLEAEKIGIDLTCTLDRVVLETINNDWTQIVNSREILFR